jgi:hypothetical protein
LSEKATPGPWLCEPRNTKYYDEKGLKTPSEILSLFDNNDLNDIFLLGAHLSGPRDVSRGMFTTADALLIAESRDLIKDLAQCVLEMNEWIKETDGYIEIPYVIEKWFGGGE